jgi:predicted sulfurtransferase
VRRGLTGLYPHGHRTHCNHGHPFDEENTATRNDCGGRVCRTCAREACARYRASHLEERRRKDREYKRLLAARAT